MRKMKDSGVEWIGEIPEDWEIIQAKYCTTINHGTDPKTEGDVPVYGSGAGSFKTCGEFKEGPVVLVGRKGATLHIPHYIEGKYWNVDTAFDVSTNERYSIRFYYYVSTSFDYKSYMSQTTLPSMTQSAYRNMYLPFMKIKEQEEIVDYLDKKCTQVDDLIANVQTQIEKLKAYKQSLITEVVTKGLDPTVPMKDSGVEWIGEIADTHTIFHLKYLLDSPMQYGANESGDKFAEDSVRYIRITDITADGKLKDDENNQYLSMPVAEGYILKDKDVLFARSGGTVGKSFLYREEYGTSAFAGYLIKAECDQASLMPEYLIYYTQSSLYELWKNMIFIQATIQNIGANKYSNMEIPVPSIKEQAPIVEYLDEKCSQIDRLISLKQSKIEKLEQYKKSLIYEYVTGKKEVI